MPSARCWIMRRSEMKVRYISIYHFCRRQDAEYHVRFNRGKIPADTPRYKTPTASSLRRVARLFYDLEYAQPSFETNFLHLQAYTKEPTDVTLLVALGDIAGPCSNYTGPTWCLENGRVIGHKYGAEAVCDQCIANRAIHKHKPDIVRKGD